MDLQGMDSLDGLASLRTLVIYVLADFRSLRATSESNCAEGQEMKRWPNGTGSRALMISKTCRYPFSAISQGIFLKIIESQYILLKLPDMILIIFPKLTNLGKFV